MSVFDDSSHASFWVGVILVAVGTFFAWAGYLAIYGYGQLIENSDKIVEQNKKLLGKIGTDANQPVKQNTAKTVSSDMKDSRTVEKNREGTGNAKGENFSNSSQTVNVKVEDGEIICPKCKFRQPATRKCCWSCGVKFHVDI